MSPAKVLLYFLLFFIGGIFYLFCFFPKVQIKEIKVYGNEQVSFENIQKLVDGEISHKILFLNSKSILLVNGKRIKKEILNNFPQIAKINLKRNFPSTLILEVEERKPIGIWCASQIQKCFNVDKEGIIFSENSESLKSLTIIDSIKKDNVSLGEKIIQEDILNSIEKLETGFKEIGIQIKEIALLSEERLNVRTDENWEIYFNLKGDLNWQLEELNQILQKEIRPEKRVNLEYIDLRFSRVYYKYR